MIEYIRVFNNRKISVETSNIFFYLNVRLIIIEMFERNIEI